MKCKWLFPLALILWQSIFLQGQSLEFSYDANGNRLSRTVITAEQLESSSVQFPIVSSKSLKLTETMKTKEAIIDDIGEIVTNVFPNPTKGFIKVDITNMPLNAKSEMRIYNISGNELSNKRIFDSYSEIDISDFKDGLYILRIKIDDHLFDWKIVKSQK